MSTSPLWLCTSKLRQAHTLWCGFLTLDMSVTKIDCSALFKSTCRFKARQSESCFNCKLMDLTFQVDNHPHIFYYADPKEYFQSLSVGGISFHPSLFQTPLGIPSMYNTPHSFPLIVAKVELPSSFSLYFWIRTGQKCNRLLGRLVFHLTQ